MKHIIVLAVLLFCVRTGWGQTPKSTVADATEEHVLQFTDAVTERWEFGLEIEARGNVRGITATVPIPVEWPEQSIKVIEAKKTDDVTRVSFKDLGGSVKQMLVSIRRLPRGAISRTTMVVEIKKRNIVAPSDTSRFVFAKQISKKIKPYLTPSPNIESRHERLKEVAAKIPLDEDAEAWDQVKTIFDWVRDNIEYKFDPTIRTCLYALDNSRGDCEELSSLFIAICRVRGIPARAVWIPGHTYPEFYLADERGNGHWIPCQPAGPYEFGSMTESKPILQKGDKFRVRGHKETLRYVQPTIEAKDASAAPQLKWIMQKM